MTKPLPKDFDIRYSQREDLQALEAWFADPKEREPFPFQDDMETAGSLRNWIGFSKYNASLTGIVSNEICAVGTLFLMPYRKVAHHALFYLIVHPAWRRKGIGTSMVRNLMHLAKTRFRMEGLHAEIYDPNPIVPLLSRLNFELNVRQENFVQINGRGHARILMEVFF